MLLKFRCSNYRSYKDEMVISALSKRTSSQFFEGRILPVIALYGANASGKSNAFRALGWMRNFILKSGKLNSTDTITVDPFLFEKKCEEQPSNFEVTILIKRRVFRYGFSVTRSEVVEEWLFQSVDVNAMERCVFRRRAQRIEGRENFKRYERILLKNSLLLAKLDQNNDPLARSIMEWMVRLNGLDGVDVDDLYPISATKLSSGDSRVRKMSLEFLRKADPTIIDTATKTEAVPPDVLFALAMQNKGRVLSKGSTVTKTMILRRSHEDDNLLVGTEFNRNESSGTRKMFMLSGPVTDVLVRGGVMVLDELEAELHPLLVDYIIQLFMFQEKNPHKAQLIFTTHDVGMMERANLTAEQVYICSKNLNSESTIYALSDFPAKQRKVKDFVFRYLSGEYGGIPTLDDYAWLYNKFGTNRKFDVEMR